MSEMLQLRGRHYGSGRGIEIDCTEKKIEAVRLLPPAPEQESWPWIAPGFFDLQVNGYGGTWYADTTLTPKRFLETLPPYLAHGITRIFPTLITASHESLAKGFRAIAEACDQSPEAAWMVAGCHLEGPYLSGEDGPRGAHPREHIRPADWDEFQILQENANGLIKLVTLAPEVEGAIDFIRKAVQAGIVISIGHTAATAEQISAAVDAGALLSTHLGNGAHPVMKRHPNYIWDQLGEPRLNASLIADGFHLAPSVLRSMVWGKGVKRIILTCDASGLAGCAPGIYPNEAGGYEVLPEGKIVVAGQRQLLAGSALFTDSCVATVVRTGAATLAEGVRMVTEQPLSLFRLPQGDLRPGDRSDLVLFHFDGQESNLRIVATISAGEVRHGLLTR